MKHFLALSPEIKWILYLTFTNFISQFLIAWGIGNIRSRLRKLENKEKCQTSN
jgi:hypothetical protein